jgi:hypothetical protein
MVSDFQPGTRAALETLLLVRGYISAILILFIRWISSMTHPRWFIVACLFSTASATQAFVDPRGPSPSFVAIEQSIYERID